MALCYYDSQIHLSDCEGTGGTSFCCRAKGRGARRWFACIRLFWFVTIVRTFRFLDSRIFCIVLFVLIVRIVQVLMFLVTGLFLNVVFTGLFGRVYVVDLLSVFLFGVVRTVCLSGMSGFVVGLFGHFGLL